MKDAGHTGTPKVLHDAYVNVKRSKDQFNALLKKTYPVGSGIRWQKFGGDNIGEVLHIGHFDVIKVRNFNTGKNYWISFYDLTRRTESSR